MRCLLEQYRASARAVVMLVPHHSHVRFILQL